MKKILMVSCDGLGNGGVQTVMMQIVRSLKKEYVFDALLFTDEVRYFDEEFLSHGGQIFRMPRYKKSNPVMARCDVYLKYFILYGKMKKLFRENGYDAIHCHNDYEAAICLKAAKKAGIKIRIAHQHTEYKPLNFFDKILNKIYKKMLLKNATDLIGASESACVSYYGEKANFEVINNPYNEEKFIYTESEKHVYPVICQVGSFNKNKNQKFTLEIFKDIIAEYPESKLHLVGCMENDYSTQVKNYIEQNKLEGNVCVYPHDADVCSIMNKSNIFIMPSLKEGFGIVLIEAQAVGLNCYASDTIPKLTNVGGCVYLSLDKKAGYWAQRIIEDFKNGEILRKKYDTENFTTKKVCERYKRMYGGN